AHHHRGDAGVAKAHHGAALVVRTWMMVSPFDAARKRSPPMRGCTYEESPPLLRPRRNPLRSRWSTGRMVEAPFLRSPAVAVRRGTHVVDMDVAFLVKVAEQGGERIERLPDVLRLLGLRVGLVGDPDVEVEARLLLLGERAAAHDPVRGVHV